MMQPNICANCGDEFTGGQNAVRCDPCKKLRKNELRRAQESKKRIGRMKNSSVMKYTSVTPEPHRHGVEVTYVDGGMDRYGKRTFLEWLREGAFKPGDVYLMDGQRHVVCEC